MRVAPYALFPAPFELAAESAHHRITPKGTQLVGLLADILARLLVRSYSLKEAILGSLQQYGNREDMGETREFIDLVLTLYQKGVLPPQKNHRIARRRMDSRGITGAAHGSTGRSNEEPPRVLATA